MQIEYTAQILRLLTFRLSECNRFQKRQNLFNVTKCFCSP